MKKFKVGVIGCGNIAQKAHFPNIYSNPELDLICVADVDIKKATDMKEKFHAKYAFSDYKDLLKLTDLDAVHICTPNYLHAQIAIESLKAGKHVLIEKPVATTVEDTIEIYKIAKECNKTAMSANCFRYVTEGQVIKKFIDNDKLGEIYYANVKALRRRGIPPHGVFTKKEFQGGGPLIDIGIHQIDLAMYLMGNPKPLRISGQTFTKIGNTPNHAFGVRGKWDYRNYDVEDFACGMVRFDNGAIMSIETSFAANIQKDVSSVTLLGNKGGADTQPICIYTEEDEMMIDITPVSLTPTNFYDVEIKGFYKSIKEGTKIPITYEETLNVIKIIEGIYKSSEQGREIELP